MKIIEKKLVDIFHLKLEKTTKFIGVITNNENSSN